MANKINFEIGFTTNSKGLNQLKSELAEIRKLTQDTNFSLPSDQIGNVLKSANNLEHAMTAAFNPKLNTVNVQKFNNILKQSGTNLAEIQKDLSVLGATGNKVFAQGVSNLMSFNNAAKQSNEFLNKIGTAIGNTIRWSLISSAINTISSGIQQSYYYVKDLDSALNDIRIVTGKNADEMSRFSEEANNAAKSLAVTTEDYTKGSLIYYQQGLDDDTVKALTDITAKTSNVTGQSMGAVSEELTAVWNGYQAANEAAKEGMQVYEEYVDKMAAVGASTASDLQELSTAMSKVASAASSMGVDFDDLNAQIATIVSVTRQAPESVGTALKTIYARLGDLKVDGVDEFGVKLGEITGQLQTMGIQILDSNGDMRDMSSVMAEVAEKWNTWTSAQRQAAAVAMAGKRQYNNLVALFDNWDMYGEALQTSMEAVGTLEEQQEIALDSLSNKMDQLRGTAEDLYDSLYNEEDIKGLVEGLIDIVQGLADFSDSIGGLATLLPMLGSIGMRVFSDQIANGLNTIIVNTQNAILGQKEMQANYANLQMEFSKIDLSGSGKEIEDLKQFYDTMYQYQSVLSSAEQEQYNSIKQSKVEIIGLNEELQESLTRLQGMNEGWELIDIDILKSNDSVKENAIELTKQLNLINIFSEKLKNVLVNGIDEKGNALDIVKNLGLEKIDSNLFKKVTDQITLLNGKSKNAEEILTIISNKFQEIGKKGSEVNNAVNEINGLTKASKEAEIELEKIAKQKFDISNIVNVVGAFGQLTTSINTIKNLGSIWFDKDVEIGDKILQTIMNLSFALPALVGFFTKLNSILPINLNLIKDWKIAIETASAAEMVANVKKEAIEEAQIALNNVLFKDSKERVEVLAKEIIALNLETDAEIENYIAKAQGIKIEEGPFINAIKKAIIAKKAEAAAEDAATVSTETHNAAMLATPIGIAIAAITAIVAALAILHKKREQQLQDIKENNQEELNEIKANQEIVNQNEKLIESYNNLYNQYKKGKDVKNEIYEKTLELAEAYDIEDAKILALGEHYDILTEKIKAKREEELKESIQESKEGAQTAAENAVIAADEGSGKYNKKTGTYTRKISGGGSDADYNPVRLAEVNAMQATGLEGFNSVGEGYAHYNYEISLDVNNPEEVKNYIDQLRVIKESLEASLENPYDSSLYKDTIEELKQLSEYEKEINNQLKERYTLETELAISENKDKFQSASSLSQYYDIIDDIRDRLSGIIPEKEIDKYLQNALKDVEKIGNNYEKITLATKIAKSQLGANASKEELEKTIKDNLVLIEGYNDRQLATLDIYFNPDADGNLKDWINKNQWLFDLAGKTQTKVELQGLLSGFASSGKFDKENLESLFDSSEMGDNIQKAWEQYSMFSSNFSKEAFINADVDDQAITGIYAYINAIKDLQEHKDEYIAQYEDEIKKLEETTITIYDLDNGLSKTFSYEHFDEAKKIIDAQIENAIAGTNLEEQYNDLTEAIKNYGEEGKQLDPIQQVLINNLLNTGKATESDIEQWKNVLTVYDSTKSKINALTDAMHEAENAEYNVVEMTSLINGAIKETNTELDNLQSSLKSLIDIVSDYNETGHFTVDHVQSLMTMEDSLVASLEISTNSISLNEEALKNNTIAKLANLQVEALAIYQKEQEKIAEMKSTDATIEYTKNVLLADAAVNGMSNTVKENIKILNKQAKTLHQAFQSDGNYSEEQKRLEDISWNAYQNRTKAIQDAMSEVNKGGYNFRRAMGTPTQADKDKDKQLKKTDKEKEHKDDEIDRYWEINKALEKSADALKKLDELESHVFGKQKIQVLQQEKKLIQEQTKLYEQLYEEQKKEAEELRGKLSAGGMTFSAEGEITNYGEALKNALASYNAAVDQFNAGLMNEEAFKVAETNYENFKKNVDRYDKLFYTEMKNTREQIEDEIQKLRDINLEQFEIKLQVKTDKETLKKEFREFRREMKKDFTLEYEILPDTKVFKKNFNNDKKNVKSYMKAMKDIQKEIDIIMAGGTSKTFASLSEAQEKLKEVNKDFEEASKTAMQDVEDAWENYIALIDQTNEKLEQQQERYEAVKDELDDWKQMIELVYGDKAYDKMNDYYKQAEYNSLSQIDATKKTADAWEAQFRAAFNAQGASMDRMDEWSEDLTKLYENWKKSEEDLRKATIEHINLIKEDYANAVSGVLDTLEKKLTGGMGLEDMEKEWEQATKWADKYYNEVQKVYNIQTLNNKIQKSINQQNNFKNAQKLEKVREKELALLREQKYMTEYDLKAAEAKYEITLKEIALEDARNNKSTMKLSRNSEGNWSYQYVADETDVADKQQDLLDAIMKLQDLSVDQVDKLTEERNEAYKTYLAENKYITDKAQKEHWTQEQLNEKLKALENQYFNSDTGIITLINKEFNRAKEDAARSGLAVQALCYEQDRDNFKNIEDEKKQLFDDALAALAQGYVTNFEAKYDETNSRMKEKWNQFLNEDGGIYKTWDTTAAQLGDRWNADDGKSVKAVVGQSIDGIKAKFGEYLTKLAELEKTSGVDFGKITGYMKNTATETNNVNKNVETLLKKTSKINTQRKAVEKLKDAWDKLAKSVEGASKTTEEYLKKNQKVSTPKSNITGGNSSSKTTPPPAIVKKTTSGVGGGGTGSGDGNTAQKIASKLTDNQIYDDPNNKNKLHPIVEFTDGTKYYSKNYYKTRADYPWMFQNETRWKGRTEAEVKASGLKTGGYTGTWSGSDSEENGRLAILHQKELVLNAKDTENFLAATNSLRDIASLDSSIEKSIANAISKMLINMSMMGKANINGNMNNSSSNNTNNTFNITAEFPNANDVTEIREAILSLPNLASQYVSRQRI